MFPQPTDPDTFYTYKIRSKDIFDQTREASEVKFRTKSSPSSAESKVDLDATSNAQLTFYANYDSNSNATFAKGSKESTHVRNVAVVPDGKFNGGLYIGDGRIAYSQANNFDVKKGTIAFWF